MIPVLSTIAHYRKQGEDQTGGETRRSGNRELLQPLQGITESCCEHSDEEGQFNR